MGDISLTANIQRFYVCQMIFSPSNTMTKLQNQQLLKTRPTEPNAAATQRYHSTTSPQTWCMFSSTSSTMSGNQFWTMWSTWPLSASWTQQLCGWYTTKDWYRCFVVTTTTMIQKAIYEVIWYQYALFRAIGAPEEPDSYLLRSPLWPYT